MAFDKGGQFYRNWFAFFLLGTINNFSYVLVNSSAQALVDSFDSEQIENLIGLVPAANVIAGFAARSLNTWLFDRVSAKGRIGANSITMFASLGLLALFATPGPSKNFWFCLIAITILGGASSFGESALVGYIRSYPPELVGGWSSGTGMAGMSGSGLFLALSLAGLPVWEIYYIFMPSVLLYVFAFWVILVPLDKLKVRSNEKSMIDTARLSLDPRVSEEMEKVAQEKEDHYRDYGFWTEEEWEGERKRIAEVTPNDDPRQPLSLQNVNEESNVEVEETTFTKWRRAFSCVGAYAFFLFMAYFCGYVILTGAADKAESPDQMKTYLGKNSYTILAFLYQVGSFTSRSSLAYFKIKRVWILVVLQMINMVLWVLQATYHFLPIWSQFILMVYVGLCTGGAYVNICYQALNSDKILEKDRELCVNIIMFASTFGVLGSSLFTVVMDYTWLNDTS